MRNICLEVVEASNKFEENNFKNKDLKKMYIKKNIDIINNNNAKILNTLIFLFFLLVSLLLIISL